MTTTAPALPGGAGATFRMLLGATSKASRSPWVWTPAAVGTAGFATATLALARLLTSPPATLPRPAAWPVRLSAVRPGVVRLSGAGAVARGCWGVDFGGGHGIVGDVLLRDGAAAERPFRLLGGAAPAGSVPARLSANLWRDRDAFTQDTGIAGDDVVLEGETGPLPAWVFRAGDGRRWAVLVHGRGASRAQMLRLVPRLHAHGITALVVSYRNDEPGCVDPTGRMHFGQREWRDVEVAVVHALHHGARDVVLGGMSLGGGIIATFLRRAALAPLVVGTILDAPALNWGPILRHVARNRRVPGWIVPGVMAVAALHARIDWAALNHVADSPRVTTPVLLVHGDADPVVPVQMSDAYAATAPDLIVYLRVAGAGHVSAWNAAPEQYDAALDRFLAALPTVG